MFAPAFVGFDFVLHHCLLLLPFVPHLSIHTFPAHFRPPKMLDFDGLWQKLASKRMIAEKMNPIVVGDIAAVVVHLPSSDDPFVMASFAVMLFVLRTSQFAFVVVDMPMPVADIG